MSYLPRVPVRFIPEHAEPLKSQSGDSGKGKYDHINFKPPQAVPPSAASSVAVSSTNLNQSFFITAVNTDNGSGLGLSTVNSFVINPFSGLMTLPGIALTNGVNSTSASTGSLYVQGGVGIGLSLSIGGRLQLFNGASYTSFISSASGNTTYTLPATSPATGSSVLSSTSTGVMSWMYTSGTNVKNVVAIYSLLSRASGVAVTHGQLVRVVDNYTSILKTALGY